MGRDGTPFRAAFHGELVGMTPGLRGRLLWLTSCCIAACLCDPRAGPEVLTVHVIAHSHEDPGWRKRARCWEGWLLQVPAGVPRKLAGRF